MSAIELHCALALAACLSGFWVLVEWMILDEDAGMGPDLQEDKGQ